MGWTGFDKWRCEFNANGTVNKKKTMDREVERYGDLRVVKSQMGGGNWYAVVQYTEKSRYYKPGTCFLMICLIRVSRDEFLYKDMDDCSGPYETDCPKVILDLADELCPINEEYGDHSGYAKEWRAKCRAKLATKTLPTAFAKCKPGQRVEWHVPEDSALMMGGSSIAGQTLILTKIKGYRSWIHDGLWRTKVPTKYVNPSECTLMAS